MCDALGTLQKDVEYPKIKGEKRDAFETRQYQMETGPTLVATSVQSQVNWVWGVSANKAFDYPDDL